MVVTITHGVPDYGLWWRWSDHKTMYDMHAILYWWSDWQQQNGSPVLTAVALKQGLQDGTVDPRSRWESPKVQRTMSGGRKGRMRMRMRQGSKMREEVSMVALSRGCLNFSLHLHQTEGVKSEKANEKKLSSESSPWLLWRKMVIPLQTRMWIARGTRE